MRLTRSPSAWVALLLALAGCSDTTRAPSAPARVMSFAILPRQVPPPTQSDITAAYDLAYGAGARGALFTSTWKDLEPTAGALDVSSLATQVNGESRFSTIFVGIQLINTVVKEVPADLADSAFDASTMKLRFHALIDALAAALPGRITYLSIGNEVDGYLELTDQWVAYQDFYDDAVDYVHTKMPGTQVGVTGTYAAATGALRAKLAALNAHSDIVALTYYPIGDDFHVADPSVAEAAINAMLGVAGSKPLVVQEIGYPASPLLGSSDSKQAAFFTNAIAAWAKVDARRMPFVSLFVLHDFTPEQCDAFGQYYGLPNNAEFEAFLCTLGLRLDNGTPRPAWQAVVDGVRDAGLP